MLVDRDGNLIVGVHAQIGSSVDIYVLTLSGSAVVASEVYNLGTATNDLGSVDQMGWLGDDIVFSVRGESFTTGPFVGTQVGIFRPQLGPPGTPGTLVPVPTTPGLSGDYVNAMAVDAKLGVAYFVRNTIAASGAYVYGLPVPGTGAAVTPTLVATIPAVVLSLAVTNDSKILFAGVSAPGSGVPYVSEIDPQVTPATETLLTFTPGVPNGVAYDPATGDSVMCLGAGSIYRRNAVTGSSAFLSSVTGVASGAAIRPALSSYGDGTPVANHAWQIAPNPGGLPKVGNTGFSLTVESMGSPAPGVLALSFGSAAVPLPQVGITLLLDPASMVISQFLPAQSQVTMPLAIPAQPSFAGIELFAQTAFFQASSITSSNGLRISIF